MRNKLDFTLQFVGIALLIGFLTLTTYSVVVHGTDKDELVITTR